MKSTITLCAIALCLPLATPGQELSHLKWQESGIHEKSSGFRPHAAGLSTNAPAGLKKAPAGLKNPLYGSFEIGPSKAPATIMVIFEEAQDGNHKLYLDSNGNGDFTDDPPCTTELKPYKTPAGEERKSWRGQGSVVIPFTSGPRTGKISFYRSEGGPAKADARQVIFYYSDYGLVGDIQIGDSKVSVALADAACSGEFKISSDPMATPTLWLDVTNANRTKGLTVLASRPFMVDGKWWAMTNLTQEGDFSIVAATKPPETKKVEGPDLSPGKKAPVFAAKLLDGKPVKFPDDYKGKIVMLDFWATWCGPCVAEIPNVVKAYGEYHSKGYEILGVSLDKEDWEQKLADFTKKKEMPWPQVYDGKFWGAEVAKLYGIHSIPHMILVDGTTGKILADGGDLRGEGLAPTIEKALNKK
jgi:peroxiredoxin